METPTTCSTPREPTGRCSGDAGAGLVEYALLLALIVVACIGAVTFLGGNLNTSISRSTSKISAASP
jgi:Flp pilus assembly pilin Flp